MTLALPRGAAGHLRGPWSSLAGGGGAGQNSELEAASRGRTGGGPQASSGRHHQKGWDKIAEGRNHGRGGGAEDPNGRARGEAASRAELPAGRRRKRRGMRGWSGEFSAAGLKRGLAPSSAGTRVPVRPGTSGSQTRRGVGERGGPGTRCQADRGSPGARGGATRGVRGEPRCGESESRTPARPAERPGGGGRI